MTIIFLIFLIDGTEAKTSLTRLDSLFIIAATGEPRFKVARESCEKILVLDSATPNYLLHVRLTGQSPRQRHYVEHLFAAISDSGKNPIVVLRIAAALPISPDSVQPQLLHIGSELGDSAFLPIARLYLKADSEEIRKAAVRSLGTYPKSVDVATLLNRIAKTSSLERQENLWALSRHGIIKEWPKLIPVLQDEYLYNRQIARRLLVEGSQKNWEALEKYCPLRFSSDERLEWILLAMDIPGKAAHDFLNRESKLLSSGRRQFLASIMDSIPNQP